MTEDQDWRILADDWHEARPESDCGCTDQSLDTDLCGPSTDWSDDQYANRPMPELDGHPDPWDHETWYAAWGCNAPMIMEYKDYRIPSPPDGAGWLMTRMLVRGQKTVELALVRSQDREIVVLARSRSVPEPSTLIARAQRMVEEVFG